MLRDDNILLIKERLDSMVKDESKKIKYEAIITLANHNMNLDVHIGEDGAHQILWYNRKIPGNHSFDDDLQSLVEYIDHLDQ